ncbi:uncharacterized protein K452DRAFT_301576 [Aplosporella prunicola CBS 121167]|uniref:Uncharacterized protein n=1 Tax=Aplosporella prunicola CBS 121167 TaxID=1176127 RepID=A0A6A6B2M8_9PEZI|nr:uncharacterized protein K452DRAFT_301576 [Aplosporella prunicola CBS 121167]KAF2137848.1 hypothetical protein K452DRAFT_301576 [Aplosporella prunicola CBS 121167]
MWPLKLIVKAKMNAYTSTTEVSTRRPRGRTVLTRPSTLTASLKALCSSPLTPITPSPFRDAPILSPSTPLLPAHPRNPVSGSASPISGSSTPSNSHSGPSTPPTTPPTTPPCYSLTTPHKPKRIQTPFSPFKVLSGLLNVVRLSPTPAPRATAVHSPPASPVESFVYHYDEETGFTRIFSEPDDLTSIFEADDDAMELDSDEHPEQDVSPLPFIWARPAPNAPAAPFTDDASLSTDLFAPAADHGLGISWPGMQAWTLPSPPPSPLKRCKRKRSEDDAYAHADAVKKLRAEEAESEEDDDPASLWS